MQKLKRIKYWAPLICALMFAAGMWLGIFLNTEKESHPGIEKFNEMLSLIQEHYVDEVNLDSLIEKSLPGILGNLDPHSAYIPAKDLENANQTLRGSFGGIGIRYQMYRDTINIVEVIAGGPSEKAGLYAGDRIIAVDGRNVTGKQITIDSVPALLKGPELSSVNLTIVRPSAPGKTSKYKLVRGNIPVPSIDAYFMADKNTGYVRVSSFGQNTYREFMNAMVNLATKGAEALILDLRGNTGGYMEPAVLMANEFLPINKTIVSTRGRNSQEEIIRSDGTGAFVDLPLTILVDEMTASAAEILSGAMQDHDRGLLIGRRTFGKGLVQKPMQLSDGSEMRLTIQRYYTPSGRSIQKQYKPGHNDDYELEVFERFRNGELTNRDSVKINEDLLFNTEEGRPVYGGGGILPDVFVPEDTTGVTRYYLDLINKGLLMDYAYEFTDQNRAALSKLNSLDKLLSSLPSDTDLLNTAVYYAANHGVPARWYYINQSSALIIKQLKALIARNVLGLPFFYQVLEMDDPNVKRALKEIRAGNAAQPISIGHSKTSTKP